MDAKTSVFEFEKQQYIHIASKYSPHKIQGKGEKSNLIVEKSGR